MKTRNLTLIVLLAVTIAMALAAAVMQGAVAQDCTPGRDCPDEREKKATVTDVPPTPPPTETPLPVPPAACLPPDADQLAVLCAGLIPPPVDPAIPIPGTGDDELTNPGTPDPDPPESWPLILLGGGLFLGGMVIGRLLPAVQKPPSWARNGGGVHPPDPGFESLKQKVSPFQKMQDGGEDAFGKHLPAQDVFPKVESQDVFPKVESQDVFPKVESQDSFANLGDEGSQKVFPKVEGQSDYMKLTGDSAHKLSPGDEAAGLGETGMDTSGLKQ